MIKRHKSFVLIVLIYILVYLVFRFFGTSVPIIDERREVRTAFCFVRVKGTISGDSENPPDTLPFIRGSEVLLRTVYFPLIKFEKSFLGNLHEDDFEKMRFQDPDRFFPSSNQGSDRGNGVR
jgi:hypothetical protein